MIGPTPGAVPGTTSTRAAAQEWRTRGACRTVDPELFFAPDDERGNATKEREAQAKAVCATCPVLAECLDDALEKDSIGVWGGTNDAERRAIRKAREEERKQAKAEAKEQAKSTRPSRADVARRKPTVRAGCGTPSGGRNHSKHGEEPCEPCLLARREHDRQQREAQQLDELTVQIHDLLEIGADIYDAARALGMKVPNLERALYRRGQHDLFAKLTRRAA